MSYLPKGAPKPPYPMTNVRRPLKQWTRRKTGIQWTTMTWNPIIGCSRCSEGCRFCYAIPEVNRKQFNKQMRMYLHSGVVIRATEDTPFVKKGDLDWSGKVILLPERLEQPLKWKAGFCFVNSLSDLWHDQVSDEDILRIIDTMRRADHIVFQVLTKRAGRLKTFIETHFPGGNGWPGNVWVGVSVENMLALHRARILAALPLPLKFLSVEPQIELITGIPVGIHQVLQGGESGGNNARPFNVEWAQSMLKECREKNIAFFLKQLGTKWAKTKINGRRNSQHGHGGDPKDWPPELRVREYPVTKWNDKDGNLTNDYLKGTN